MSPRLLILGFFISMSACAQKPQQVLTQTSSTSYCSGGTAYLSQAFSKPAASFLTVEHPRIQLDGATLRVKNPIGFDQLQVDQKADTFSNVGSAIVPAGTKLVAVVDHECTKRHASAGQAFTGSINREEARQFENSLLEDKTRSYTVSFDYDMTMGELEEKVNFDRCVKLIASDVQMKTFAVTTDPREAQQTHLVASKWDLAYPKFYVNPGINQTVVIAIIDSGVDITHEDLSGNLWVNTGEIAGNGVDDDGNGYIDDRNGYNFASRIGNPSPQTWPSPDTGSERHGTHVAGLAGAQTNNSKGITGIMGSNVKIMALNVFGATAAADSATIDEAIRYAINKGAHVINLSLGGLGKVASTGVALQEAISANIVVVAASGNSNLTLSSSAFMTPASFGSQYDGMISVGSIDSLTGNRSRFSNCSTTYVELGAPGAHNSAIDTEGLVSTYPSNLYGKSMGTSMSSPVVAGAAALAIGLKLSLGQTYTSSSIESLIHSTGTTSTGVSSYFKDGKVLNFKALADSISP